MRKEDIACRIGIYTAAFTGTFIGPVLFSGLSENSAQESAVMFMTFIIACIHGYIWTKISQSVLNG